MTTFVAMPFDDETMRYALQLIAHDGQRVHTMGTALLFAPGIAVTALHILNECHKAYGDGESRMVMDLSVLQPRSDDDEARIWTVDRIVPCANSDIALLRVVGGGKSSQEYQEITLRPPVAGDRIVGFGFLGRDEKFEDNEIVFDTQGRMSTGEVTDVFPNGRDRLLAPFPCFHVNARFDDGMSGGPVFTEDGLLCGVVSRGLQQAEDVTEHASVVAMIWPLLTMLPGVTWRKEGIDAPLPLYEMYRRWAPNVVDELARMTFDGTEFTYDHAT